MEPVTQFDACLVAGNVKQAMRDAKATSRDLWSVEVSALRILTDFNVRIHDAAWETHIRALANSMKVEGFYQDKPMAGYVAKEGDEQVIYITDGHCRYNAVRLANSEGAEIERVPVVVSAQGTSLEDLTVALFKSNSGKPLSPFEIGIVCKRLSLFGWNIDQISTRLDMTEFYVDGLLRLVAAPKPIREMVQNGQVSASVAIQVLRAKGNKAFDYLQSALNKAQGAGKERVTAKHLPEHAFQKSVKKAAPALFGALVDVKADPGYQHISPELREKLELLVAQLNEAKSG